MEYYDFFAMNTGVQIAAEGDPEALRPGFERARRFVDESEERFSRFRETSELSRLNRSAGAWFFASSEMFDVVREALAMHALTDGLFDPSVLKALRRAGYDRSMDEIRRLPEAPLPQGDAGISPPFDTIGLDPETSAIRLPVGMEIDLGGIAKGWIAARAAELMMPFTEACAVSAGGDMALLGLPAGQHSWAVSLEDPRDPERVLAVIYIQPGGLATSTVTRRRWIQGGRIRHHIIDPQSGEPTESSWLSVTVSARSAIHAETFAKALLIAGPSKADDLAARVDGLQYAAVNHDGDLSGTLDELEIINVPDPIYEPQRI